MNGENWMTNDDVLNEFHEAGALLRGHFVLSSGLHSDIYLQCARIMMDARRGEKLCAALVDKIRASLKSPIDMIVSPAIGGIVVGYEMGRQLNRPAIFMERIDGKFMARRGFHVEEGARCLMVEDVITTGLSSRECIAAIAEAGAQTVAGACLIDRSEGKADIGVPIIALASLHAPVYQGNDLPSWLAARPAIKPGSRETIEMGKG